MPRIRSSDVDEVKARTNIGDVIGERVALKPAGVGSLKGLCPFHDERTPSFHVRPQAGYYHCFGCGESGDVYTFLREMDHLSFTEAVERLAGKIGYALHYEDGGAATEPGGGRARLYAANTAAAEYFRAQLLGPGADAARRFLGERGFDAGAAAAFGIGYAPQGWSNLQNHLSTQGFSDEELLSAGLLSQGQRGAYDRFRGRVMWPIRDVSGQTIGFGARRLFEDDKGPKYLNTPETQIYKKNQVLYGLDLAKRDISRGHQVVVVEGYTDVMACHHAGVKTAIATCGTAFGGEHVTVLRRVMGDDSSAGEVIFTFDPDEAGQKAALRAFGEEKRFAAQSYVAVAPEGLDPCDLRLERGDGAVRALVDSKRPLFEFVIDKRIEGFDLASVEGQIGALRSAAPVVADIRDRALRPGYTRVLARKLGLDIATVEDTVRRAGARRQDPEPALVDAPPQEAAQRVTLASLPRSGEVAVERDTLMGVLQFGHGISDPIIDDALSLPMRTPALDAVRAAVVAAPDRTRVGWTTGVVDGTREPYRTLATELITADFPARTETDARASTVGLARHLVVRSLEHEKARLLASIGRVAPDSEEGRTIRVRLRELDARRREIVETQ